MKTAQNLTVILLILAFAFGNIYKFSFFSQDVHVSLIDGSVFVITVLAIIFRLKLIKEEIKMNIRVFVPLSAFLLVSAGSLVLSLTRYGSQAFIVGSLYWLRFLFYSFFFVILKTFLSPGHLIRVIYGIITTTVVTCLGQYLLFPDIRFLKIAEWDPHYYRVVGTLLDPGFAAMILVFILIYLFTRPLKNLILNRILLILTYLLFAFTYSRSGFLALFTASVAFSWVTKSWKTAAKTAVLVILTIVLLPRAPGGEGVKLERTSSIQARIINWRNSLTIFFDHPLLGVGFNTYRYAQKQYGFLDDSKWLQSHAGAGADSSLLFVAATTGIIGLIAYLAFIYSLWKAASGHLYLQTSLSALFFHSFFLNSLFYPWIMVWISLLLSLFLLKNLKGYK